MESYVKTHAKIKGGKLLGHGDTKLNRAIWTDRTIWNDALADLLEICKWVNQKNLPVIKAWKEQNGFLTTAFWNYFKDSKNIANKNID